ncbi:hypothetical protein BJ912DRAFT_838200, partial [Pholiota molesta]
FLYRFYNAPQMGERPRTKNQLATTFADDAMFAVAAPTLEEAARGMGEVFAEPGGPGEWEETHHSLYEFHKFAALGLTRRRVKDPACPGHTMKRPPLQFSLDGEHMVTTTDSHPFLGAVMDSELRFKKHAMYAIGKGMKWLTQVRRLSKVATGMRGEMARRLFYSVAVPSMLYVVDVWLYLQVFPRVDSQVPASRHYSCPALERVQQQSALQVTGALRTTPSDMLFAHADMDPMAQLIWTKCQVAALRLATVPEKHPLYKDVKRAAVRLPKKHPSALGSILSTI